MQTFPFGNGFCISLHSADGICASGEGESYEAACFDVIQFLRAIELF